MRWRRNGNGNDRRGELIPRRQGSVRIRKAALQAIIAHARQDAPDECCGLLVGPPTLVEPPYTEGTIEEAVRATNVERGPTRYRIDPVEHVVLQKRLRGTGRAIAGAYHSHTHAPAVPSVSDLAEAFYPEFVYLIVSLANPDRPEIRGWRIIDAIATELTLTAMP